MIYSPVSSGNEPLQVIGIRLLADAMKQPTPRVTKESFEQDILTSIGGAESVALEVIRVRKDFASNLLDQELENVKEQHPSRKVRAAIRT